MVDVHHLVRDLKIEQSIINADILVQDTVLNLLQGSHRLLLYRGLLIKVFDIVGLLGIQYRGLINIASLH